MSLRSKRYWLLPVDIAGCLLLLYGYVVCPLMVKIWWVEIQKSIEVVCQNRSGFTKYQSGLEGSASIF